MNKLNENNNLITTVVEETNQNKIRKNNLMAKRIADILRLIPTYLSSILVVVVLAAIIIYVFVTGAPAFSLKLLTDDYKEKITAVTYTGDLTTSFEDPNINGSYFSIKYGIAVADSRDTANEKCMIVTYIADNSPLKNVQIANGEGNYSVSVDDRLDTVMLYDEDGLIEVIGKSKGAEKLVEALDSSTGIMNMQCKTSGGGARGSLITTIYLILLTLIIALPIGVIASIFLTPNPSSTSNNCFNTISTPCLYCVSCVSAVTAFSKLSITGNKEFITSARIELYCISFSFKFLFL